MLRRPLVIVGLALVAVGLIAALVSFQGSDNSGAAPAPSTSVPSRVPPGPGVDAASPKAQVARLQERVEQAPDDWASLADLGSAYVAEAAVTGDPSLYPRAEESIDRSFEVQGKDNLAGSIARSKLAAARHDFTKALEWADKALDVSAANPTALGAKGDALLELGRYDDAFAIFQKMINLRPGLPSYSRVSYALELQGDFDGALRAMRAAESATGSTSDASFAAYQVGELQWNRGNTAEAVADYQRAADLDPDAVRAQAALARASYFAGDTEKAIAQYQAVTERFPLPKYLAELADIYDVTGQDAERDQQLELVDAQRKLFEANGVSVDADLALINADYGIDLEQSLADIRAEYEVRKTVFIADSLAWLLQANGRSEEALTYATEAQKLGSRNALFSYHRSVILRSLGDDEAADQALAEAESINPNFSIRYSKRP